MASYVEYERDLAVPDAEFDENRILDRFFHSGQSVVFRDIPLEVEPTFKRDLAHRLRDALGVGIHPLQLIVCGSAHLGFSPVPSKLGKPFDPRSSDVDVAVVSGELFDVWWLELQAADLLAKTRSDVAQDLFWGFINPSNVSTACEMGRKWWGLFGQLEFAYANGGVRGRLYRSYWAMQNYHLYAIQGGRTKLLGQRA